MYIKVKLLNGFREPLWYKKPDAWQPASFLGEIVYVPLRNQKQSALVISQSIKKPSVPFEIKAALAIEQMPNDPEYKIFIQKLSCYYQISPLQLLKRIRMFVHQKQQKEAPPSFATKTIEKQINLTDEQQTVVNFITPHITKLKYTPSVIHGVTGSGKTEIYKNLIATAIAQQKTALLLLPEVTLAIEFEKRLQNELSTNITIASFHSGTSTKQKRQLWQRLLDNKPTLIIGVHIPVLLPIPNLGLIIVDEEHEVGYQEKKHPKINSKEAAIWRAQLNNIPILLGSATPSISTLYNVKKRNWHFFSLKKRFAGSLPTIQIVELKKEKHKRKQFWISKELQHAIADRLEKKEQAIIFLNRRGYSFFIQCKDCSFIPECSSCSVSLTLHSSNMLHCHYCQFSQPYPTQCPKCKKKEFIKKGIGTQQLVSILQNMFPIARIARADMDVTAKKKLWQQTVKEFKEGAIDILVGTQTITKGYHFPNVTLVGILWADLNLHFPMYNAAETTLQQLIQVSGRAGRQSDDSLVIVQTMSDHPVFSYLNETDYLTFYNQELESRKAIGYPPCMRLVEIELKHSNESTVEKEAQQLAVSLQTLASENIKVLGPAKPPVHKIKNSFSRKIYLKAERVNDIINLYAQINKNQFASAIFFSPNPVA